MDNKLYCYLQKRVCGVSEKSREKERELSSVELIDPGRAYHIQYM